MTIRGRLAAASLPLVLLACAGLPERGAYEKGFVAIDQATWSEEPSQNPVSTEYNYEESAEITGSHIPRKHHETRKMTADEVRSIVELLKPELPK
ncbi:hypothetical protein [Chitinimonas sp.]|uniref:hypothetical protein n=1 Tax=Chitinimonas sp. TaxID=1934313 RepID=UPI0035B12226